MRWCVFMMSRLLPSFSWLTMMTMVCNLCLDHNDHSDPPLLFHLNNVGEKTMEPTTGSYWPAR